MSWCDFYIASGDKVRITNFDGNKFDGRFLFMDLGKYVEEDDTMMLEIDDNNIEFQCSNIKDIEEL